MWQPDSFFYSIQTQDQRNALFFFLKRKNIKEMGLGWFRWARHETQRDICRAPKIPSEQGLGAAVWLERGDFSVCTARPGFHMHCLVYSGCFQEADGDGKVSQVPPATTEAWWDHVEGSVLCFLTYLPQHFPTSFMLTLHLPGKLCLVVESKMTCQNTWRKSCCSISTTVFHGR